MFEFGSSLLNRRDLARGTLGGGASLVAGAAMAQAPAGNAGELLDARHLGATGDGKTDDTAALQRAIDTAAAKRGAVFLPPGDYLTGELQIRPGVAMIGIPAWNYGGAGGSVLRLAKADALCLLNLTDARGVTIDGLALDGGGLGQNIHGMFVNRTEFAKHEDAFRIERCQVMRFSGDGLNFARVWCFSIRHSMLAANGGDGLNLRGWDGFLLDNWFSGNKRAGFAARHENASITFTSNRIEWNGQENMLVTGGDGYQITGNFFDRAGTCGLALRKGGQPCRQFTITGNYFKRSGKHADAESQDSAQMVLDGARGVTCIGNNFQSGRDDGNTGVWSPSYGLVVKGLENCVVANNVLQEGALRELFLDFGGHGEGVVIRDNPGRLFVPRS